MSHWRPKGAESIYGLPAVGDIVPVQHAVWRVIEVIPRPVDLWDDSDHARVAKHGEKTAPHAVVLRPVEIDDNQPRAFRRDRHIKTWQGQYHWMKYTSEHYPVCAKCHEPLPCRDVLVAQDAARSFEQMQRFTMPGVCPSCAQPITQRQKTRTFDENLELPGGPPVTFHVGRSDCRGAAARYEERWVALDPANRRTELNCPGEITHHGGNTYSCTVNDECRGPLAFHQAYRTCAGDGCCEKSPYDCHPWPQATRINVNEVTDA